MSAVIRVTAAGVNPQGTLRAGSISLEGPGGGRGGWVGRMECPVIPSLSAHWGFLGGFKNCSYLGFTSRGLIELVCRVTWTLEILNRPQVI